MFFAIFIKTVVTSDSCSASKNMMLSRCRWLSYFRSKIKLVHFLAKRIAQCGFMDTEEWCYNTTVFNRQHFDNLEWRETFQQLEASQKPEDNSGDASWHKDLPSRLRKTFPYTCVVGRSENDRKKS